MATFLTYWWDKPIYKLPIIKNIIQVIKMYDLHKRVDAIHGKGYIQGVYKKKTERKMIK